MSQSLDPTASLVTQVAPSATPDLYPGVYAAKVYSISDPRQSGRVQLYVPQIFGDMPVKIWAPPLVSGGPVPAIGAVVWCVFQGGDPSYPTYLPPSITPPAYGLTDASWTNVATLLNGYTAWGAGYDTPQYRRINGLVYVRAALRSGTQSTAAFNLPSGYRPQNNKYYATRCTTTAGTLCEINIQSGGNVNVFYNGTLAVGSFVAFDISFDPSGGS